MGYRNETSWVDHHSTDDVACGSWEGELTYLARAVG